jgi:hypothetical protein
MYGVLNTQERWHNCNERGGEKIITKIPGVIDSIAQVINEYIEKQRPCGTPEGITKGDENVLETRTRDFLLVK